MGGTKPWPEVPVGNRTHTSAAVVIIGAGISGKLPQKKRSHPPREHQPTQWL